MDLESIKDEIDGHLSVIEKMLGRVRVGVEITTANQMLYRFDMLCRTMEIHNDYPAALNWTDELCVEDDPIKREDLCRSTDSRHVFSFQRLKFLCGTPVDGNKNPQSSSKTVIDGFGDGDDDSESVWGL